MLTRLEVVTVLRGVFRRWRVAMPIVITIALATMGLTLAYVLIEPVRVRGLAYRDSAQLVAVLGRSGRDQTPVAMVGRDGLRQLPQIEGLSYAFFAPARAVVLSDRGVLTERPAAEVSDAFFDVLGVPPALGRYSDLSDLASSLPRAAVSHKYWKSEMKGDRSAIGTTVEGRDGRIAVVAVLPELLALPWLGFTQPDFIFAERREASFNRTQSLVVARRPPHLPLDALLRQMPREFGLTAVSLQRYLLGGFDGVSRAILSGAVVLGLEMLATVALLTFAFHVGQRDRNELLLAVGAPPSRLWVIKFAEVLLLSVAGGVLGSLMAAVVISPVVPSARLGSLLPVATAFSWRAVGVALVISVIVAIAATLADSVVSRREQTKGHIGKSPFRARATAVLVVVQIAAAVALLTAATAVGRSLLPLMLADLGFDPANLFVLDAGAQPALSAPDARHAYISAVLERVRATPGVIAAAGIDVLPMVGAMPDRPLLRDASLSPRDRGALWQVTPEYFEAMRLRFVAGRPLQQSDLQAPVPACVVTRSAVPHLRLAGDGLGASVPLDEPCVVVGVVDEALDSLRAQPWWGAYVLFRPQSFRRMSLVVRMAPGYDRLPTHVAAAFSSEGTRVPVRAARVQSLVSRSVAQLQLQAVIFNTLTVLVVFMAFLGGYSVVVALLLARRRQHVIQLALGASRRHILQDLSRHLGLAIVGGVVLGLISGYAYQQFLHGSVPGFEAISVVTVIALASSSALGIALLAGVIAARVNSYDLASALKLEE